VGFEVRGLTKRYGGNAVVRDVDLAVTDGEIHALLGANGAGKSTLIKCIGGATTPDAGEIVIRGEPHSSLTPRQARNAGVAIIYQEYSLASTLTVAENIFLGDELRVGPVVRRREQRRRAREILEWFGAGGIDPGARVETLSGADQQVVEIAKAIKTDPSLLLLDEPTASLTEAEVGTLMAHLRRLRERDLPILYVTHRLGEVFELADRVTVLRDGAVVLSASVADLRHADLVEAIAGGLEGRQAVARPERAGRPDESPLLEVTDLVAPRIGPVSLTLERGEILGIFGLVGSGRTELLNAIFGASPRGGGRVLLEGKSHRFRRPVDAIRHGVAMVPSERLKNSLFPPLTSLENLLLPVLRDLALGRALRVRRRERRVFHAMGERLGLQPPRHDLQAGRFSGGNQQKLILGRWLGLRGSLRVLFLDEPTQGVDVGARRDIYEAIQALVDEHECGVVLTSSDEDELEIIADRALVLSRGLVVGELRGDEIEGRRMLHLAHLGEARAA
jgi:ribose transport system ATP-binding protein